MEYLGRDIKPLIIVFSLAFISSISVEDIYAEEPFFNYEALVMGNSDYPSGRLYGPNNDADDISKALGEAGFNVTNKDKTKNLNRAEMKSAINNFMSRLDKNSFAVIYFSGHGVEDKNENYLVPVDVDLESEEKSEDNLISLEWILKRLRQREARTKIIILDACRNVPMPWQNKGAPQRRNWAEIKDLGPGVRIIYATSPNGVARAASPGERNSVYTGALIDAFNEKHQSFSDVLDRAARLTLERTNNDQTPWSAGVDGMSFKLPPQVSVNVAQAADDTEAVVVKYDEPKMQGAKSCTPIAQVITENGVSTWTKKCI